MTTIFEFLMQSAVIFLSVLVPGYLVSLALFKRTGKFNHLEMLLMGIPFGMFLPSVLALIEFSVGIMFSQTLAVLNVLLITFISLAYLLKNKIEIIPHLKEKKSKISLSNESFLYGFLLVIVLLLAWWVRVQSLTPYYYDFDPYWYNHATQFIIEQGQVPASDDYVWYPNESNHRTNPPIPYMEATWYHLYSLVNGVTDFNFELMTIISELYPPMIAMLTVFFAYLWISREYSQKLGILLALLLAFTPVFLGKTGAGSFEFTPFGFFGFIAFYTMFALSMMYKSREIAIASGFMLALGAFGSNSAMVTPLLFAGLVGYSALSAFIRGKHFDEFIKLIIPNVIAVIMMFLFVFVYYFQINVLPITQLITVIGAFAVAYALNYLLKMAKTMEDKLLYLSAIAILGILVLLFTPARGILDSFLGMAGFVATYQDVTSRTIAEQTAAPTDFYGSLGVLGLNLGMSTTPIIIVLAGIAMAIVLINQILRKEYDQYREARILTMLAGTVPIALAGLFKAKFVVFMGVMTPIAFAILIGELTKIKQKTLVNGLMLVVALMALVQFVHYSDVLIKSLSLSSVDIMDNGNYIDTICSSISSEINSIESSTFMASMLYEMKVNSYQIYCSRIPESWVEPMLWIRNNVELEDRIMSWWDYGHWTNNLGQRKSVTGNTHVYTMMHQEVADKIVGSDVSDLISYMKEHKAKYLLLDQDLIGKWGALVYHSCNYNNQTTVNNTPGSSICDALYSPEYLYLPLSPTSSDYCSLKTSDGTKTVKVYSLFGSIYGFNYYCLMKNNLPLYYENKSIVGIEDIIAQGQNDNSLVLMALYSSANQDAKGYFYNSIFYKGFFEGSIPGMTQVYPSTYSNKPNLPVRIYKINE